MTRIITEVDAFGINDCSKTLQAWLAQTGQFIPEQGFRLDKILAWQFVSYFPYASPAAGQRWRLVLDLEITPWHMVGREPDGTE